MDGFSLFLGIGGGGSGDQSVFSLTFHENPIRDGTRKTNIEKGKNVPKVTQLGGSLGVANALCLTPEHNFRRRCPSSAPLYSQVPLTGTPLIVLRVACCLARSALPSSHTIPRGRQALLSFCLPHRIQPIALYTADTPLVFVNLSGTVSKMVRICLGWE